MSPARRSYQLSLQVRVSPFSRTEALLGTEKTFPSPSVRPEPSAEARVTVRVAVPSGIKPAALPDSSCSRTPRAPMSVSERALT